MEGDASRRARPDAFCDYVSAFKLAAGGRPCRYADSKGIGFGEEHKTQTAMTRPMNNTYHTSIM